MTVANLAIVAFVAISLNGLFASLAWVYRRQVVALRIQLCSAQDRAAGLRNEVETAVRCYRQLLDSRTETVAQRVANDPLEQLWRIPEVTPEHERGQQ